MKNLKNTPLTNTAFVLFCSKAKQGYWHTSLNDLGFNAPRLTKPRTLMITAGKPRPIIPVNVTLREFAPEHSSVFGQRGLFGSFQGIWKQMETIALTYYSAKFRPKGGRPPQFTFEIDDKYGPADAVKIKLFDGANLVPAFAVLLKNISRGEVGRQSGFSGVTIGRWASGKKRNVLGSNQEKLYAILGDKAFNYGLDIKKFRSRLAWERMVYGSDNKAALALGVSYSAFYHWSREEVHPSMQYHKQIYDAYGLSVFKKMGG